MMNINNRKMSQKKSTFNKADFDISSAVSKKAEQKGKKKTKEKTEEKAKGKTNEKAGEKVNTFGPEPYFGVLRQTRDLVRP